MTNLFVFTAACVTENKDYVKSLLLDEIIWQIKRIAELGRRDTTENLVQL